MLGKIRIDTNNQAHSRFWNIYLDDVDITKFVRNIDFVAGVSNPIPQLRLEIIGTLEMPEVFTGYIDMKPLFAELEHAKKTIERLTNKK